MTIQQAFNYAGWGAIIPGLFSFIIVFTNLDADGVGYVAALGWSLIVSGMFFLAISKALSLLNDIRNALVPGNNNTDSVKNSGRLKR